MNHEGLIKSLGSVWVFGVFGDSGGGSAVGICYAMLRSTYVWDQTIPQLRALSAQ